MDADPGRAAPGRRPGRARRRRGRRPPRPRTIRSRRCGRPRSGPWSGSAPSRATTWPRPLADPARGGAAPRLRGGRPAPGHRAAVAAPRPRRRRRHRRRGGGVGVRRARARRARGRRGAWRRPPPATPTRWSARQRWRPSAPSATRAGLPAILAALDDKATVRRRAIIALAPFEGEAVDAALARGPGGPRLAGAPGRGGPQRLTATSHRLQRAVQPGGGHLHGEALARRRRRTAAGRARDRSPRTRRRPAAPAAVRRADRHHRDQMAFDSTPIGMRRSASICRSSSGDRPSVVR